MYFAKTIDNPLLQLALQTIEPVIRQACDHIESLRIMVDLDQFPDGRDSVRVFLLLPQAEAHFEMLLRNFFDRECVHRVTRHIWRHFQAGRLELPTEECLPMPPRLPFAAL